MMKLIVNKRFALQERSATVLVRGPEIWTFGATAKKLQRYSKSREGALILETPMPSIDTRDGIITWDGSHLLVADRSERKIFRVDPATGRDSLVMDPGKLAFGNFDVALLVADSVIGDIAWYNGILYLALQAGYSSAIYGIDLDKKTVVSHRHSPGPKPCGLDLDPGNGSMYVIDNRNRELRRFTKAGKVDIAELPAEWVEPKGLSLDSQQMLWSTDWSTGDIIQLKLED